MRTTGGGAAALMVALSTTFVSFLGPYPRSIATIATTTNRIDAVTSASSLFVHGLVTTTTSTPTKTTIGGRRSATATTTLSTWWVRTSSTDLPPWRPNPLVRSRHSRLYSSSIAPSSSSSSPERGDIDKKLGGNVDPLVTLPPPSQPSMVFPPPWLRLAGYAPVEYRLEVTNQVSDAISSSGGYLGMTTLLSNLVTSMLLEDIDATKLGIFYDKLRSIPNLRLNPQTVTLLEECSKYLETVDDGTSNGTSDGNETIVWKPIAGVFQLTWTGADGRLRHQIVADG